VRAESIDVNLSSDTLRGVYAAPFPRLKGLYELGALLGETGGGDKFQQFHGGLLVTGDAGAREANVTAGLGGRIFGLHADEADGGGLALGGMIDARLPAFNRLGLLAYAYGAPSASTFGDFESYFEYAAALDYQVLQGASVYGGFRQVRVDVEDFGNFTVDTGWHLGLRLNF
jgi:hypothetical protein